MPVLLALSVALQFFCLVHMVRTGRPYWWLWIILIGSFLGVAVYIVTQVLPDLRASPKARRAARRVQQALDPARERRRIEAELAVSDTVQNRLRLARECLALGDAGNAVVLFESCLKGLHANDPHIMLGLAQAQFAHGDAGATRRTLEALITANPAFRSADGHLLYARALEQLGDVDAALHEYEALSEGYPGEEGRMRYALLLRRIGRPEEARRLFDQTLARAKIAPRHYRQENHEWIELAKQHAG